MADTVNTQRRVPMVPRPFGGGGLRYPLLPRKGMSIADQLTLAIDDLTKVRNALQVRTMYASEAACLVERATLALCDVGDELAIHYGD